jgi:hypothetical protein
MAFWPSNRHFWHFLTIDWSIAMTTITTNTATTSILATEERAVLFRTWRELYAKREAHTFDFLLYALLRGKDPRAGFTPISNANKLNNGSQADQSYRSTLLAASNIAGHVLSAKLRTLFPDATPERLAELVGAIWHSATTHFYGKKVA